MNIIICDNYEEISKTACKIICEEINNNPNLVLGLATGSTPVGTYKELINEYNNNNVDFSNIRTFNLDEYYNLSKDNTQSYAYFMKENFFKYINIDYKNTHIPNGLSKDVELECKNYESLICENGGIDLQILGIGSNGHIAFNEPSDTFTECTSLVDLSGSTIKDNARFFNSIDEIPTKAISMGIGSIFKSKKIILLASGKSKANAVFNTVYNNIDPKVPSSILKLHKNTTLILDKESASMLQL